MNPLQKQRLQRFIDEAGKSAEDLAFILNNLGASVPINHDAESLEHVQVVYQRIKNTNDSIDVEWRENLLHVVPLYIGEMIIRATDAEWISETRKSFHHQGSYRVTGFGDMDWETYYPARARQMILCDCMNITAAFTSSIKVWDLRCRILDGVVDCFTAKFGPHPIGDIMDFLEANEIAPDSRFGVARYKQLQKRVLTLLKRDPRFHRVRTTKDTFHFDP